MRHLKKKVTLDRKAAPRRALMANLAESLILHERITTTKAKAKALSSFVEKMITTTKKQTLAARRDLAKVLYTENAIKKMMEVLGPRYQGRNGGYTRITNFKTRVGDGAETAIIELVK